MAKYDHSVFISTAIFCHPITQHSHKILVCNKYHKHQLAHKQTCCLEFMNLEACALICAQVNDANHKGLLGRITPLRQHFVLDSIIISPNHKSSNSFQHLLLKCWTTIQPVVAVKFYLCTIWLSPIGDWIPLASHFKKFTPIFLLIHFDILEPQQVGAIQPKPSAIESS